MDLKYAEWIWNIIWNIAFEFRLKNSLQSSPVLRPNSVANKMNFLSIERKKNVHEFLSHFFVAKFLDRPRVLIAPRNQFISAITAEREAVYLRDASSSVKLIALRWLVVSACGNCGKKRRKKAYRHAAPYGRDAGRKEGANRIVIKRSGRGGASCWSAG